MKISRLRWYAARLAAMSPPEIGHRVKEQLAKRAWRNDRRGWDNYAAVGDGALTRFDFLHERLQLGAGLVADALADLDSGVLSGLGQKVRLADGDVWFKDPVSGNPWPGIDAYCFDVDVRATGKGVGDVKFVWEINRLQFLHPLGAAIAARSEPVRIEQALGLVRRWAAANPPYRGVNWFSGIELAMRLVSLTLLVGAIPSALLPAEDRILLRQLVAAHAFWLARFPSKYSSANNHLVAEGLGLFLAGRLAPDLPHAGEYEREGRAILEKEATLQILEDGVGAEQSPTYQAFTMEMLAFAALIADGTGAPLAAIVKERLRLGAVFLRAITDDAGQAPHIGDDDEGRVIAAPPDREPRYVASLVTAVAGLLDAPELGLPVRDLHLRDAIFHAPESAINPHDGLHTFAAGGYSVGREAFGNRNAVLTFDHGPLGYLTLAAHGHADALAIWLSIDDRLVIVDAGTFLYHSGGVMRNRLRSSAAHNTLTLEGASQSSPSSAFSWSSKADARLVEAGAGKWWSVAGAHEGYAGKFGVSHRRIVSRTPSGFTILDHLDGASKPRQAAISLLIAPDIDITREGDRYILSHRGDRLAAIMTPSTLSARLVRDDRQGGMGLFSPRFGDLTGAQQIVCSGKIGVDPVMTRIDILPRA